MKDEILKFLLKDILSRRLSFEDIKYGRQRIPFEELASHFALNHKNRLDFEAVIEEMEKEKLIELGPVEYNLFPTANGEIVHVPDLIKFEKEKHISLTAEGYKKASEIPVELKNIKINCFTNERGKFIQIGEKQTKLDDLKPSPFELLKMLCNNFSKMVPVDEVLVQMIGDEISTLKTTNERIKRVENAVGELQRGGKLTRLNLKITINKQGRGHVKIDWKIDT
jgi:hypothetical protein